ncbi:MAG: PD40 domain-containing protein [Candidatus Delongbacteria bacterium]|nr:PD40 domain-containing protein [Candidatus Delongbacteria bacterium]MBN2834208.1 PD40 domain-containing protein [Candidatus Delongbacteria bacterium]
MRRLLLVFSMLLIWISSYGFEPHFMNKPVVSPDGNNVCFVYENNLWTVSSKGGAAKRLTNIDGYINYPIYSPDGKNIAFNCTKDGIYAAYMIPADGGKAEKITDESVNLIDWYSKGKKLLVTKWEYDLGRTFYTLDLDGKRPVSMNKIGDNISDLSNDDSKIVFSRYGYPEREEYTGSMNGDLYLYNLDNKEYTQLTNTELTERYPKFSSDSKYVYYAYSDGDNFQLYRSELDDFNKRERLTSFDKWSVRNLSKARNVDFFVFELFDELWSYDSSTGKSEKINIDIKEDLYNDFNHHLTVRNEASNFRVSKNGKITVFSYRYDLFAVPTEGGDVIQLTKNQNGIGTFELLNDNKTILFTSLEDGTWKLFKLAIDNPDKIEKLKWSEDKWIEGLDKQNDDVIITYSEWIGSDKKAIYDKDGNISVLSDNVTYSNVTIDPNRDYAFYSTVSPENYTHHLVAWDFDKEKEIPLLNYDMWGGETVLSPDNKTLFINLNGEIKRIDLFERTDYDVKEDKWKKIFEELQKKDEKDDEDKDDKDKKDKKGKKDSDDDNKVEKIKLDPENIYYRMKNVVSGKEGYNSLFMVPNDSTVYFLNVKDKETTLWKCNFEGKSEKEIFNFGKNINSISYNKAEDAVYYLSDGRINKYEMKAKKTESVKFKFDYDYNEISLNKKAFEELWGTFGIRFYDHDMHGKNWKELYNLYQKYMEYSYNPEVLGTVGREMIGDINASHSEFSSRPSNERGGSEAAALGCVFDYTDRLKEGIKIKKVFEQSKLNKPNGIKPGDVLISIDSEKITENSSIQKMLLNKTGNKIKLVFDTENGNKEFEVKGMSFWKEWGMHYNNWVIERTKMVDEWSNGRIGYLHIEGMDWKSYRKFLHDLWAENIDKEALIIDVRNNGGGNTHNQLIEQLTIAGYALESNRTFGGKKVSTPVDIKSKPKALLMNENSFSDAEIFPQIFREMGLGKIIGVETSGYVIGTWEHELMDGSHMRLPGNGWFRKDGINMEGNGVKPDIPVRHTFEQIINDDDKQLKTAVDELLKELK